MDNNKLDQIKQDLINNIDNEISLDNDIKIMTDEISSQLYLQKNCKYEVNNRQFSFRYIINYDTKQLIMIVADINKYKIMNEKYSPYMISADIEQNMSEIECIKVAVEGFVRHIYGAVKPEMLEEE